MSIKVHSNGLDEKTLPKEAAVLLLSKYARSRLVRLVDEKGVLEVETPCFGEKSETAILTFSSGARGVLRAFADRAKFRRYAGAMLFCEDKTLPVPSLWLIDKSWSTRLQFRRWFCLEHFVEGEVFHVCGRSPRQVESVVKAVAQLHNVRSKHWGLIHRLKRSPYRQYFRERVEKILARLSTLPSPIEPDEITKWKIWFASQIDSLEEPGSYSLVHHHLGPDDILVSPDGGHATILDNGSLKFDNFIQDVEDMLSFLATNEQTRREIIDRYMLHQNHLPPDSEYEKNSLPYRTEYHLKRLWRFLKNKAANIPVEDAVIDERLATIRSLVIQ